MATETITQSAIDVRHDLSETKVEIKDEGDNVKPSREDLCQICLTDEPDEWIQCDKCERWFHMGCLDDPRSELRGLIAFHCADCELKHGPSVKPESRKRRKTRLNYAALNNGIVQIENTHSHVQHFKAGVFPRASFPEVTELTSKFDTPVIVRAPYFSSLKMTAPTNLTPRKVARLIGEDYPLPVMDVVTQNTLPGWTTGRWADYFETPEADRTQILNVISLEFTDTPLQQLVKRPAYVDQLDLVDKVWPKPPAERPKVKYYCLMGVAGGFTDFHVDFGGTSVFYHVVSGRKTFAFIKPTKRNLAAYEKWCTRQDQESALFSNSADECVVVDLTAGDTMIIPSGWIHAVYTPEDSMVVGGNFLTLDDFELQLQIAELERRTNVPEKFTFPQFRKTVWHTANYLVSQPLGEAAPNGLRKLLKDYLSSGLGAPKGVNARQILERL